MMMNRPRLEDFMIDGNAQDFDKNAVFSLTQYSICLKNYCNELEKALDKACENLAFHSLGADEDCWNFNWNEDEWKEWLLNDE